MYAVVSSGGKQYRVEPGTTLTVERMGADAGAAVTFDRVLLIGDGEAVTVGSPVVAGATVTGTVLGEELGPKLVIFKFKQKVKYRRRTGHRQHLVRVRIDAINADGEKKARTRGKAAPEADVAAAAAAAEAPVEEAAPKPRARRAQPKASGQEASAPSSAEKKPAAKPRAARKPKAKAEE
ncbi:MAG TPA: 50S ribosomal protein L21 [Candidatus Limnocylindria bacterium]